MKKNILKVAVTAVLLISVQLIFSNSVPPPNGAPGNPGFFLPIDGGVFTLFALAFGYGVKELKSKK